MLLLIYLKKLVILMPPGLDTTLNNCLMLLRDDTRLDMFILKCLVAEVITDFSPTDDLEAINAVRKT